MVGYVYIMASKRNGTIYVGVTSNLIKRAWEHRQGVVKSFTKKYEVKHLVYYEVFDDIQYARKRELRLKKYTRKAKLALIEKENLQWNDLYETIL